MLSAVASEHTVSLHPSVSITFVIASLLISWGILKRMGKGGCLSFAYISVVVGTIMMFGSFAIFVLVAQTKETVYAYANGEHHTAKVIDYTSYESYDKEHNRYTTMYKPIVQFTANNGAVIKQSLGFSTSNLSIGDSYNIIYTPENDSVLTLGFTLILTFVGASIFAILFGTALVGAILFAMGKNMDRYWRFVKWFGFTWFIPIFMIGFEALLIYGFFYGNPMPKWVYALLLLFIIILALGIWAYIKQLFSKGLPTTQLVGTAKWNVYWDDEGKKTKSKKQGRNRNWMGDDKKIY